MEIGIFYNWQPHNKINGSLFYAFEYANMLYGLDSKTKVHFFITSLRPLSQKDKDLIYKVFYDKYIDTSVIIKFSSIVGCHLISTFLDKALFLDVKSYNTITKFLPGVEKHLYCNNKDDMINSVTYPENIYYWYERYQIGKYKTKLKLYFDIHKTYPDIENNIWFVSSIGSTEKQIELFLPDKYILKQHKKMVNIYKDYQKIMYIHNGNLDTNNRLIPEAMYFNKDLHIKWVHEDYMNDSIFERYIDIKQNGLESYTLDDMDIMIQNLLGK